jgi:hypothetical protein
MNINRLVLLLLLLFVTGSQALAQKLDCDELAEILGIESWRVPMPKEARFHWSFAVVDYAPRKYTSINTVRLNPQKKALATLRNTGQDVYEFAVKTDRYLDRGEHKLDVCTEKEKQDNLCDNRYSITWYSGPKPFGDGTSFVIADITTGDRPRKQIILRLQL